MRHPDEWRQVNDNPPSTTIAARLVGLAVLGDALIERQVPIEAPIALEYSGIGYAVMMATPADIEDFVIGHALAEGLVGHVSEVGSVDVSEAKGGWIARAQLSPSATDAIHARARTRVSDSSCGLCGVDSIEEALRRLPTVTSSIRISRAAIARALDDLPSLQHLNLATGAVHAAAFCKTNGQIVGLREDVGRHNAFDKLIGTMARAKVDMADGFALLSARSSFELVEKAVRCGVPMLVTVSAPTSLAVDRAKASGLTLLALARSDNVIAFNDPNGCLT